MNNNQLLTRYIAIKMKLDDKIFTSTLTNEKIVYCHSGVDKNGNSYPAINCVINKNIGFLQNTATIQIFGLLKDDINTFTRANLTIADSDSQLLYAGNKIEIYGGYALQNNLPPLLYIGQIRTSAPDYNDVNRPFNIVSTQTFIQQNEILPPTNNKNTITLDNLFKTICIKAGFQYRGFNIENKQVENVILTGSFQDQMQDATSHYGYNYQFADNQNSTVLVFPINQAVTDLPPVTWSVENGGIGYPMQEEFGICVRFRLNPNLLIGQVVNVQSEYPFANGKWYINALQHVMQNKKRAFETIVKLNRYFFRPAG